MSGAGMRQEAVRAMDGLADGRGTEEAVRRAVGLADGRWTAGGMPIAESQGGRPRGRPRRRLSGPPGGCKGGCP